MLSFRRMDQNKSSINQNNDTDQTAGRGRDEKYAHALASMASLDYTLVSLVLSIVVALIFSVTSRKNHANNQTQQLLNGLKEVKDLQK